MAKFDEIKGSCFCGANQFAITQPAVDSHHCHCSVCRRLQGAAFVTLSIFPKAGFRWTKGGDLQSFSSSDQVHRNRCKICGSPLTIDLDALPDLIAVSRACIDPAADTAHPAESERHAFWPDRVPWLALNDNVRKAQGFDK
ncbi:MAG: GFA family protein [Candidatus Binataceae bacterium]